MIDVETAKRMTGVTGRIRDDKSKWFIRWKNASLHCTFSLFFHGGITVLFLLPLQMQH